MDILGVIDERAEECLQRKIRVDHETNQRSVIDLVVVVTGAEPSDAGKTFRRLLPKLACMNTGIRTQTIRINGSGKLTPVADTIALMHIILALPSDTAKTFRAKNVHLIMSALGKSESKIELATIAPAMDMTKEPTRAREVMVIGSMKCALPFDDDLPEVKERCIALMKKAEEVYVEDRRALAQVRTMKDLADCSFRLDELRPNVHEISEQRSRVFRKVKVQHQAHVESREDAIKSRPCSLITCNLSHVYIITQRGTRMFKIGVSENPHQRLSQLQTASPFKLEIVKMFHGTRHDEQYLHRVYKQFQTSASNEWFCFQDGECALF